MPLTAPELNYLVFRYLQEAGLEVPAYALANEIDIEPLTLKFNDKIPAGELVNLVQRGILYNHIRDYSQDTERLDNLNDMLASIIPHTRHPIPADATAADATIDAQTGNSQNFIEFTKVLTISNSFPAADILSTLGDHQLVFSKDDQLSLVNDLNSFAVSKSTKTLNGDLITAIQCTHNQSIITGTKSGALKLFNKNLNLINSINIHQSPISKILSSPSNSHFISIDFNGSLIVWDTLSLTSVHHIDTNQQNVQFNWLSDSKFILSQDNSISILNLHKLSTIVKLPTCHSSKVMHLKPNPSLCSFLSIDANNELKIWDSNANYPIKSLMLSSFPIDVYWISDDSLLIVGIDGCIRVIHLTSTTGNSISSIPDGSGAIITKFQHSKLAVLSSLGQVSVFHLHKGGLKSLGAFSSPNDSIQDMAILPNGVVISDLTSSSYLSLT